MFIYPRIILILVLFTSILPISVLHAQPAREQFSDAALSDLIESFGDESDIDEETLADLQRLLEHPINLNTCDAASLISIPWIDRALAQSIIALRVSQGVIHDKSALLAIPTLTTSTFERISPFLTTAPNTTSRKKSKSSYTLVNSFNRRLDLSDGYNRRPEDGARPAPSR